VSKLPWVSMWVNNTLGVDVGKQYKVCEREGYKQTVLEIYPGPF
jgi:hypothetical protein